MIDGILCHVWDVLHLSLSDCKQLAMPHKLKHVLRRQTVMLVQDCAFSVLASVLSLLLVRWISSAIPDFTVIVLVWVGLTLVFSILASIVSGSNRIVSRWATVKAVSSLTAFMLIKEILVLAAVLILGTKVLNKPYQELVLVLSDIVFTAFALFYLKLIPRVFYHPSVEEFCRKQSRLNALVFGTDDNAVYFSRNLEAQCEYQVIGLLTDDKEKDGLKISTFDVIYISDISEVESMEWHLGGIDCIFFPNLPGSHMNNGTDGAKGRNCDPMSGIGNFVKRSFDLVLSSLLILVFFPLAAICAMAIKIEDGGPVLYSQERIGKNGRPFRIRKFRSMIVGAEAHGAQLYSGEEDPRLTKVGRFLRKHHLDELPQLWNVFVGDMSFVGYRPERSFYIEQISESAIAIFSRSGQVSLPTQPCTTVIRTPWKKC